MTTELLKSKKKRKSKSGRNGRSGAARISDIVINGSVHIPPWVTDHDSFRRWACSDEFPERGRFAWLNGKLWVEVSSETLDHLSDAEANRMRSAAGGSKGRNPGDILIDGIVRIPAWVRDLESFRRWTLSTEFPVHGRFSFLDGKLWADLTMETLIHNLIKGQIGAVLTVLAAVENLGMYLHDGMLVLNRLAGISNEPDGAFISNKSIEVGRVRLDEGNESRMVEGSPDMALEVVSKSSVEKDTLILKEVYAKAGITEYWLVDSTIDTPELVIMRLVAGKYVAARKHDGWVKSKVFNRSFRLTCKKDAKGVSHFNLETK